MASRRCSQEYLEDHLRQLGVAPGMEVVVHASLLAFGNLPEKAKTVVDAIQAVVGPAGGIAVPTFTFNLDPALPFDPATVAPRAMGALPDYFWTLPGVQRTGSCIHSYAAIGSMAPLMQAVRYDTSFGPGSFFDLAIQRDMYWVMLGCDINSGCTLIHHSEAVAEVPYREWLSLARRIQLADGRLQDFTYQYFSRKTNQYVQNFDVLKDQMLDAGSMVKVNAPRDCSLAAKSSDIQRVAMDLLTEDPYALVREA